jgi:hypothetical protein
LPTAVDLAYQWCVRFWWYANHEFLCHTYHSDGDVCRSSVSSRY